jgi:hypothetical protein
METQSCCFLIGQELIFGHFKRKKNCAFVVAVFIVFEGIDCNYVLIDRFDEGGVNFQIQFLGLVES